MVNNSSLDLSLFPKELKLIFEILKKRNDGSIILDNLLKDINWNIFLELTNYHRVFPIIYSYIKKEDGIPLQVIRTLNQEYKKNTLQMLKFSGEMKNLSQLFIENNIRLLFLKGPVIAHDLYGDISLRTSKDLDMLIPIADLKKAENLLLTFGYEKDVNSATILNEGKLRDHHVTYFHRQKKIQIEIHWRLHPLPSYEPNFNKLWERRRTSSITSYPVYFLGKEDLFLYLVSHGSRHGWLRLRWLTDIDQMVRNGLCIDRVNILLKKYKSHHIGGQALILTSQLLNTPIEKDFKKLIEGNQSKRLAQKAIEFMNGTDPLEINNTFSKYYNRYLFSLKSVPQKFFFIFMLFYPNYLDAKTLRLPKPLHFLYFSLRPFLWAWRKTRKIQ